MQILLKATEKKVEIFWIVTKTPHEFTRITMVIYRLYTRKCPGHVLHSHASARKCHTRRVQVPLEAYHISYQRSGLFVHVWRAYEESMYVAQVHMCSTRACVTFASHTAGAPEI